MTSNEKLEILVTKFDEIQQLISDTPISITDLECSEKLTFIYDITLLTHPLITELLEKSSFIFKVQNELSYQISGSAKIDLTTLSQSDILQKLYDLTENISLDILGKTKTDDFKV